MPNLIDMDKVAKLADATTAQYDFTIMNAIITCLQNGANTKQVMEALAECLEGLVYTIEMVVGFERAEDPEIAKIMLKALNKAAAEMNLLTEAA